MTLRQILDVLWKRKWITIVVTAVALLTAVAYLAVRDETYLTSGTIRLNAIVTEATVTGEIGGVAVDLDPATVKAPIILDPAAEAAGESSGGNLAGSIDVEFSDSQRLGRLYISGEGPTPENAQRRTNAVIEAYRAYVDEQVAAAVTTLQAELQDAIQTSSDLNKRVRADPSDAIAAANLATAIGEMTSLQSQLNQIDRAGPTTTVLNEVPLGKPTAPSSTIVLLLAFATGLIVGMGAALIRDQFDNRVRDGEAVAEYTDANSLGELSWDRSLAKMKPPLPIATSNRTNLSEGLRSLRSSLQVLLPARSAVLVVTSVEPGDGKSFVSANLALAWARAGKQVILVGGDLRRPDLSRYFDDAADGEGLADILTDHDSGQRVSVHAIESRLNVSRYRRLRLLPSGAEPPDPADLLASPAMGETVDLLRGLADIVIIDSPPAMGMADAALLGAESDGVVVIATVRRTDRARLVDVVANLRANGVTVLGTVANRSRRRLPKTYSSYYLRHPEPTRAGSSSAASLDEASRRLDQGIRSPDPTRTTPQRTRAGDSVSSVGIDELEAQLGSIDE